MSVRSFFVGFVVVLISSGSKVAAVQESVMHKLGDKMTAGREKFKGLFTHHK